MKQHLLLPIPPINQIYFEARLYEKGYVCIAGVDEVGRGCLAGPVMAASVILPKDCEIEGINDSKTLSLNERERLYDLILNDAVAYGIGLVTSDEIDHINILQASRKAMKIAVDGLNIKPQYLLVDGNQPIDVAIHQQVIPKGDLRSVSIGAASIVAKVTRDRMMSELEKKYSNFKFSVHKGYGTRLHLEEIKRHGPTPIHRMTFAGVKAR